MPVSYSHGSLPYLKRKARNFGIKKHVTYGDTEIGEFLLSAVNMKGIKFPSEKDKVNPLLTDAYTITGHAFEIYAQSKVHTSNNKTFYDDIPYKYVKEMYTRFVRKDEPSKIEILSKFKVTEQVNA